MFISKIQNSSDRARLKVTVDALNLNKVGDLGQYHDMGPNGHMSGAEGPPLPSQCLITWAGKAGMFEISDGVGGVIMISISRP